MRGIDIGLFDFDRHNALYYFIMNADEEIYMRYGGRDSESADTYLNLRSLEAALRKGLELHAKDIEVEQRKVESLYPRDIPMLANRTLRVNACVECHLIADYQNLRREADGNLDKVRHMYLSPDIKVIGIELDVPKGLVVKSTSGAAMKAGMKPGDTISTWDGHVVWTFGDLQYRHDKLDRDSNSVSCTVDRDGETIDLVVELTEYWWHSDQTFRRWSIEPLVYFKSEPLTAARKKELGLQPDGFASRVTDVDIIAQLQGNHDLEIDDVVFSVDGVEVDAIANTAELFIKLRKAAGQSMQLGVLRGEGRIQLELTSERQEFRK
jgi:hypothetical protein